jgi:amino acid transporter
VTSAGGLYAYARVPFGPVVGGVAGTLLWSVNSVIPNAAIAVFLCDTLGAQWSSFNHTPARVLFLSCIYGLLTVANTRGTLLGARLSVLTAMVKLTPLVLLVVAGSFAIHITNLHWSGLPTTASVGKGAVLLFFAFMGVEGGLNASGEVKEPARTVPRAILLASVLVAALYTSLQCVAQGVLGPELATSKAPLAATATVIWGDWGRRFLMIATILSAVGYLAGDMLCSPRAVYALAERGQLPRRLANVHTRFATPAIAIGSYAFVCFVVAAMGSFHQLVIIGSSGTLLLYLICCLGLLRMRAMNIAMAGEPFRAPGKHFVPIAASVLIVWMLTTLELKELAAVGVLVIASAAAYAFVEWWK